MSASKNPYPYININHFFYRKERKCNNNFGKFERLDVLISTTQAGCFSTL